MKNIYLDNAATSWPKPAEVSEAMVQAIKDMGGSPGRGQYHAARQAGGLLAVAREKIASFLGIKNPLRLIFTPGATYSLNQALFGFLKPGMTVAVTAVEHNAVARPLRYMESLGIQVRKVPCHLNGELMYGDFLTAIQGADLLVATHASNVTGVIFPLADMILAARQAGCRVLVDAAQTAGLEELDVDDWGVDMCAFPGHKHLLGPQGIGGLYVKEDIILRPLLLGGTGSQSEKDEQPNWLPDQLESGTVNLPGIAGLLAGVEYINRQGRSKLCQQVQERLRQLQEGLSRISEVCCYGPLLTQERSALLSLNISGYDGGEMAWLLDHKYGISCRYGFHCAPWAHAVLGTEKMGALRLSPGIFTTEKEIETVIEAIDEMAKRQEK